MKFHPEINDFLSAEGYRACLGSGLCCSIAPCPIALEKYGVHWVAPCPSLRRDDKRTYCGEYQDADDERKKVIAHAVGGIGSGCCMSMFNEERERIKSNMIKEL